MRKLVLPLIVFTIIIFFPPITFAQSSTDCWPTHMIRQYAKCDPPHAKCLKECSYLDTTPKRKVCFEECGRVTKLCTNQAVADYRACVAGQRQTNQTKLSPVDIKSFLEQLEKTQAAIDQCPSPRVPSKSSCVAAKLPTLDIPAYVKDINFKYADSVILDNNPAAQVVSFSKDTNVPKSVDVNKYSDPSDFIPNPEIHIAKKTARPQFILGTEEAGTSEPSKLQYTLSESDGEYSVFNMPGKVWGSVENLVVLDKDPRLDSVKVGDPAVNNITGMVLADDAKVTLANSTDKSVMEVSDGARIVVAGWAAEDTLEAAKDFVNALK